jgi:hypothetical protein
MRPDETSGQAQQVSVTTSVKLTHFQALKCRRELKSACVDSFDEMSCMAIFSFCGAELAVPYSEQGKHSHGVGTPIIQNRVIQGRNPYDMSKPCVGSDFSCYEEPAYVSHNRFNCHGTDCMFDCKD